MNLIRRGDDQHLSVSLSHEIETPALRRCLSPIRVRRVIPTCSTGRKARNLDFAGGRITRDGCRFNRRGAKDEVGNANGWKCPRDRDGAARIGCATRESQQVLVGQKLSRPVECGPRLIAANSCLGDARVDWSTGTVPPKVLTCDARMEWFDMFRQHVVKGEEVDRSDSTRIMTPISAKGSPQGMA